MYTVYTVKLLNKGTRWEQHLYKFTCFDFCREVDLFSEVLNFFCNYREINFLGPQRIFILRLHLGGSIIGGLTVYISCICTYMYIGGVVSSWGRG